MHAHRTAVMVKVPSHASSAVIERVQSHPVLTSSVFEAVTRSTCRSVSPKWQCR